MAWGDNSAQSPEHLFHTFLFLIHIGVDIQVEGGTDVGMTEEDTDSLIVAAAFYAAGGETVAESVKLQLGHAELFHQAGVIVAVCAWFGGVRGIGQDVKTSVDYSFQGPDYTEKVFGNRDRTNGVS